MNEKSNQAISSISKQYHKCNFFEKAQCHFFSNTFAILRSPVTFFDKQLSPTNYSLRNKYGGFLEYVLHLLFSPMHWDNWSNAVDYLKKQDIKSFHSDDSWSYSLTSVLTWLAAVTYLNRSCVKTKSLFFPTVTVTKGYPGLLIQLSMKSEGSSELRR